MNSPGFSKVSGWRDYDDQAVLYRRIRHSRHRAPCAIGQALHRVEAAPPARASCGDGMAIAAPVLNRRFAMAHLQHPFPAKSQAYTHALGPAK